MKMPFNKSEVIALQVQYAYQFRLNDVILHLRSPHGSPLQSFLDNFWINYEHTV